MGKVSKRFGRHLRVRLGMSDRRRTFHSFPHTFKDACRAAGTPAEVHDALSGHAGGSAGSRYGREGAPLAIKAAQLAKISYSGLGRHGYADV